jgi:flavin-dependent dehydrogenase
MDLMIYRTFLSRPKLALAMVVAVASLATGCSPTQPFYFFNRYDRETVAQTWQVLRSEFDQMLLDNAREKGAEVREEMTVNCLLMDGERVLGVEATDKTGRTYEVRAPITLDCSGKEAFASNRRGWRISDKH